MAWWSTSEGRAQELARRDRPLSERFDKFVVRQEGCWGWTGCHNGIGYGYLRINKKTRLATHVSLELAGRPQPSPSHMACHTCDNPICTNPEHLWWGTQAENMQDAKTKGRTRNGQSATVSRDADHALAFLREAGAPFIDRPGL
ncbi:hypothetical protein GGQ97_002327 [Sphingomonas kaistensis]|uniref:HNH nuclease domain-containing protein n=1 Tax=Sphingomonas kaistensis TaxID=298708 RepID=A0A7X6BGK0_9SPHN|nr:HNH endonuclease [Sphingomonas kaistensis]NJC06534.1 hypothetical protein [Sphingomonas kaistensis]